MSLLHITICLYSVFCLKKIGQKFRWASVISDLLFLVKTVGKNIQNQYLCCLDNNHYYFCKSKFSVINLIVGPADMIKVLQNVNV